jgi:hypothetical protein
MRKRSVLVFAIILAVAVSFLLSCSSAEESGFSIKRIGQITSFAKNVFSVDAPESGKLTIQIRNDTSVFRILSRDIEAGNTRIEWDGCGYNRERLTPITYHITGRLTGNTGNEYTLQFDSPIQYVTQALYFALPSSGTAYLSHPGEWFVESKVVTAGTLVFEFIQGDVTVYSFRREVKANRINTTTLSGIIGRKEIAAGEYLVRIYEASNPEYQSEFNLRIENEKPAPEPVGITGRIMPEEDDDDETIWKLMTQPAVVVDIRNVDHQKVYTEPGDDSPVLGTLHGQTQTLCVTEVTETWAKIEAWNHEEGAKISGWVPLEKLKVVQPGQEYGLLIDKKAQTLSVFFRGERIETIQVCTGRMERDELYQETAAGSFLTGEHRVDYSTNGKKYDFVIQYDGGNLIHQIPYAFGNGKKDFTEGRALLGSKGSHACIRVQAEPGPEKGINAYWIWTHIPYHSRVIILDDPEERQKAKNILTGQYTDFQAPESMRPEVVSGDEKPVIITFGGDAVLGGRESYFSREDSLFAYITQNGSGYPFSGMKDFFQNDDITSINLEGVLKDTPEGEDLKKQWRFRGPSGFSSILPDGSIEVVNLANNHTIDYGVSGYESTVGAIEGSVSWCGPETPCTITVRGHLIGFAGCRETAYREDPKVISRDIGKLRELGCEYIIYQCHWGTEYAPNHNAMQEAMARACVREGANLVIGHHPHVVQGIDFIENVPVIYSLGNLCFGGTINLSGFDAMIVQAFISFESGKAETKIELIPIKTSSRYSENVNDFRPVPAEGSEKAVIRMKIQGDTGFLLP